MRGGGAGSFENANRPERGAPQTQRKQRIEVLAITNKLANATAFTGSCDLARRGGLSFGTHDGHAAP